MATTVNRSRLALYAGGLGGLFGVLPDIDHLPVFGDARQAHVALLLVACLVGSYCLARLGGLSSGALLDGVEGEDE